MSARLPLAILAVLFGMVLLAEQWLEDAPATAHQAAQEQPRAQASGTALPYTYTYAYTYKSLHGGGQQGDPSFSSPSVIASRLWEKNLLAVFPIRESWVVFATRSKEIVCTASSQLAATAHLWRTKALATLHFLTFAPASHAYASIDPHKPDEPDAVH